MESNLGNLGRAGSRNGRTRNFEEILGGGQRKDSGRWREEGREVDGVSSRRRVEDGWEWRKLDEERPENDDVNLRSDRSEFGKAREDSDGRGESVRA